MCLEGTESTKRTGGFIWSRCLCGFVSRKRRTRLIEWSWHLLSEKGPLTTTEIHTEAWNATVASKYHAQLPLKAVRVHKNELANTLRRCSMFDVRGEGPERLWIAKPLRGVAEKFLVTERHALRRRDMLPTILQNEIRRVESERDC